MEQGPDGTGMAGGGAAVAPEAALFCGRCGDPLEPPGAACARCEAALTRTPEAPAGHPLGLTISLYFTLLGVHLVAGIAGVIGELDPVRLELAIGGIDTALVLAWALAGRARVRSLLTGRFHPGWLAGAVLIACGTFVVAHLLTALVAALLPLEELAYSKPILDAGFGWGMVILAICIQPAVVEELAFRGLMLEGARAVVSDRDAVIVSAVLFAILHLMVLSFPHLLIMGLVLGFLRLRTGSLYPGMVVHAVHNALVVATEGLPGAHP